jgi:hypothetical protein
MAGPRDFTPAELARYELASILRLPRSSSQPVIKIYCLRCGRQVSPERRDVDPDGWWICARGCNTTYATVDGGSRFRPTTPATRPT